MKINEIKKITDFKHVNMFMVNYTDKLGNQKKWQVATRAVEPKCVSGDFEIPDAVVIVPYHTEKEKLVVIKEFRVPLGDYQIGFPAGLVDQGESNEEASFRELKEETGLQLTKVLKTSPPAFTTSGLSDESVSMIYVECKGEPSNEHNEASEDINVILVSQDKAKVMLTDHTLKFDVKTWLVLSTFAEYGRI